MKALKILSLVLFSSMFLWACDDDAARPEIGETTNDLIEKPAEFGPRFGPSELDGPGPQ